MKKAWQGMGRIIDILSVEGLPQRIYIRYISEYKTEASNIKWHQESRFETA